MRTTFSLLACALVGCTAQTAPQDADHTTPTPDVPNATATPSFGAASERETQMRIALPFDLHSRSTCLPASGAVFGAPSHVTKGAPDAPLALGESCVETGHAGPDGVVYSDADNPRVWTNAPLTSFTMPSGGAIAQSYQRPAEIGFAFGHGDVRSAVTSHGGIGSVPSETLLPWTPSQGAWSAADASFLALTNGLRLGRGAVDLEVDVQSPHGAWAPDAASVSVELDPAVILVPVQVYVFQAPGATLAASVTPAAQLALWDRVPSAGFPTQESDGNGITTQTLHPMSEVVEGGDGEPAHAHGHRVPDDVWAPCGVQFRLMKVVPLVVGPELLKPSGHTLVNSALYDFYSAIEADPSFDPHMLTVVFAPYCADFDQGDFGGPFPGQSLVGENFSCVRTAASGGVLAHELGHVILGSSDHPTCSGAYAENVMCAAPQDRYGVDPQGQCELARGHLATTAMGKYFAAPDSRLMVHLSRGVLLPH